MVLIKKIPASKLNPAPYNPRQISDQQLAGLKASMNRFGCVELIVWNERTGNIVSGHQRFKVLQSEGVTEIEVVVVDLDESEEKTLNVAMNNPHIAGDFMPDLQELLADIKVAEPEMFVDMRLNELVVAVPKEGNTDPDTVPENVPTRTERGQVWKLGMHRVMCGDSTNAGDVALLMDGMEAVLMNTDPPYGIDYSKLKDGIPRSGFRNHQEQWGDIKNDNLTDGKALQDFLEQTIRTALPHLKKNTAFYLWHPMLTQGTFFAAAAAAADILIHRQIIWVKPGFVLTRSGMYHWKHELCFYGWIRGNKPEWYGNKSQTSVWEVGRDKDSEQHPTQKPVELFVRPIMNHTKPGDIAYEPFAGSGSQFIACEQTDRICYGMEIDPHYCDVILRRWEDFTGQVAELTNGH